MAFHALQVLPDVYHIQDCMGVCMTLLVGKDRALLVDTGYGLENVREMAASITALPVTVLLTHAHHDHALGARWFDRVLLFPQDQPLFPVFTGTFRRQRVLESAKDKGLSVQEDDYLQSVMPPILDAREETMDLGSLHARIICCPGHTPGSAVVYVPERDLLLTGDDWNPCTWLFFREALPAQQYRANVRKLLDLPFRNVLCSHQPTMFERDMMETFLNHLTDETLSLAKRVPTGDAEGVRTAEAALPHGQVFVFDRDKFDAYREA